MFEGLKFSVGLSNNLEQSEYADPRPAPAPKATEAQRVAGLPNRKTRHSPTSMPTHENGERVDAYSGNNATINKQRELYVSNQRYKFDYPDARLA